MLWAVKPAEEGIDRGLIARFWNISSAPGSLRVSLASGLSSAKQVTHIETDLTPLPVLADTVEVPLKPSQIQTIRLMGPPQKPK